MVLLTGNVLTTLSLFLSRCKFEHRSMSSWNEKEDADNVVEEKRFRAALFKERLRSGREYQFLEREKEKIKHAGRETRARKRRAMAIPRREARRRDSSSSVELSFSSLLGIHFCTYSLSHACPQSTCASCIPFTAHFSLSLRFFDKLYHSLFVS